MQMFVGKFGKGFFFNVVKMSNGENSKGNVEKNMHLGNKCKENVKWERGNVKIKSGHF